MTARPADGQGPLRVVVVSSDTAMRRGLSIRIDCEEDLAVVGAVHPTEAVDTAVRQQADVAVVQLEGVVTVRPRVVAALAQRLPLLGRVLVAVDGSLTRRARGDGDVLVGADGGDQQLVGAVRQAGRRGPSGPGP